MTQTEKCVFCFQIAVAYTGHVVKQDGTEVIAGWCKDCDSKRQHATWPEMLQYMNFDRPGYFGPWREGMGEKAR